MTDNSSASSASGENGKLQLVPKKMPVADPAASVDLEEALYREAVDGVNRLRDKGDSVIRPGSIVYYVNARVLGKEIDHDTARKFLERMHEEGIIGAENLYVQGVYSLDLKTLRPFLASAPRAPVADPAP